MRDLGTLPARVQPVERGLDGAAFRLIHRNERLLVVASYGLGWDHISVSVQNRTPSWHELEHVKRLFFRDDEWAMQLHAPPSDHISRHPNVLHLWRPQDREIPIPPSFMV